VSSISASTVHNEVTDLDWENRRRSVRKTVRFKALVLLPDDQLLEAHTIDLSLGGACLSVPSPLIVGEECRMQMEFTACGETRRVLLITEVCYRTEIEDGYRIGVRFVQLEAETADFLMMLLQ
jgi:hypothetical protein